MAAMTNSYIVLHVHPASVTRVAMRYSLAVGNSAFVSDVTILLVSRASAKGEGGVSQNADKNGQGCGDKFWSHF